jgi:hypothetical protein
VRWVSRLSGEAAGERSAAAYGKSALNCALIRMRRLQQVRAEALARITRGLSDGEMHCRPLDELCRRALPGVLELRILLNPVSDVARNDRGLGRKRRTTGRATEQQQKARGPVVGARRRCALPREGRFRKFLERHLKQHART